MLQRRVYTQAALALGRLNHVAIVVPDLEKSTRLYSETLGAEVSPAEHLPAHGVTTRFVTLPNTKLELLHPYGTNSPIEKFLQRNPAGGIHHICIEVADIKAAHARLAAEGYRILGDIKDGAHNKPVFFIHPRDVDGVLLELEQA